MKPDGIQRSVRSSRHDRAAGDAPNIGRVERMPGAGLPKGFRRKRRKSEGRRGSRARRARKVVIAAWSAVLCVAVATALGFALWVWVIPNMRSQEHAAGPRADAQQIQVEASSLSEAEALNRVRQGLAVREPAKVASYFRPSATAAGEIVEFLKSLESRDGKPGELEWLSSIDANGLSLEGVMVKFEGAGPNKNRLAILTPDDEGNWKIDFDAFARTSSPPWSEYLKDGAEFALVRVYAAKDSYFNGPFRNDREWICYGLATPDSEQILLGYCKTGTPQAAAMEWLLSQDTQMVRTTLEIRRVAGGEPRQFEISRVVAQDWVAGPAAFDERFR